MEKSKQLPSAEKLSLLFDELADLCEKWKQYRKNDITPGSVAMAIEVVCMDIVDTLRGTYGNKG